MTKDIKVVLADDDIKDREIFEAAIQEIGIPTSLKMFKNGENLITYLRASNTQIPDLLFLDLNMPDQDGLESLEEIKKDPGLKGITVIIYSTSSSEKDIEATFLRGANVYLNKPSSFSELKKSLKRILVLDWQYQNSTLNRETFLFRL